LSEIVDPGPFYEVDFSIPGGWPATFEFFDTISLKQPPTKVAKQQEPTVGAARHTHADCNNAAAGYSGTRRPEHRQCKALGHWAFATRLLLRHCPLPHHLDRR
jgi:hypothetical protein